MEVTGDVRRLRDLCDRVRGDAGTIGLVPTMGALHEGHLSLLRRAREDCAYVVMSVFVNPLQFGPGEDYDEYPRNLPADEDAAEPEGVDVIFAPEAPVMYPRGEPMITVDAGRIGEVLEGASRPGHFRGVATVVAKLFNIVGPAQAYFGEKDLQQLVLIRRMAADLNIPVQVIGCPTVREPDGLAISSRNAYLTQEERQAATCLYRALKRAAEAVAHGERDANGVKAEMAKVIGAESRARIDYVAVVDERTFEEVSHVTEASRAVVAAWFGKTRLIDNLPLPKP
jgi:pantoate--beta-alanine ligase